MRFFSFSDADRSTMILIHVYERLRREHGQFGYRAFGKPLYELTEDDLESRQFQTFATVRKWLTDGGWTVGWKFIHWQGYVRYVFDYFGKNVPQPGQLKNKMLLEKYISQADIQPAPEGMSDDELEALYRRIVRPEIAEHTQFMKRLQLREFRNNN